MARAPLDVPYFAGGWRAKALNSACCCWVCLRGAGEIWADIWKPCSWDEGCGRLPDFWVDPNNGVLHWPTLTYLLLYVTIYFLKRPSNLLMISFPSFWTSLSFLTVAFNSLSANFSSSFASSERFSELYFDWIFEFDFASFFFIRFPNGMNLYFIFSASSSFILSNEPYFLEVKSWVSLASKGALGSSASTGCCYGSWSLCIEPISRDFVSSWFETSSCSLIWLSIELKVFELSNI